MIQLVGNLVDVADVPVEHTGRATYSLDGQGRRWIRKRLENSGCEELLAEMISWEVARRLDIPVPDGAFCADVGQESWLSACLPAVVHWDPARVGDVENLASLGAVLAFDALINNPDRHAGNILLQATEGVGTLRVWAIDHGQALVGWPDDFESRGAETPDPRNLARGLPMDTLEDMASVTAEKMTRCSAADILEDVRRSCVLAKEPKADVIGNTLVSRLAAAPSLVAEYLGRVRKW